MTARQLYEGVLIELNKENAPNILLEDFNYFANKAINNYVNKRYNIYDVNQQTTDDLRVLKATALLKPIQVKDYKGLTMAGNDAMATYEVVMPSDYLHILNCICIYKVNKTYKCYNKGDSWRAPAKRLTADMYSQVLDNFWNKPTYKKPYYYIHNVNSINDVINGSEITHATIPTNPQTSTSIYNFSQIPANKQVIRSVYTDAWVLDEYFYIPNEDFRTSGEYTETIRTTSCNQQGVKTAGAESTEVVNQKILDSSLALTAGKGTDSYEYLSNPNTNVANFGTDGNGANIIEGKGLLKTINIEGTNVSNVERGAAIRYGNVSQVRLEIRYGTDNSIFELTDVYVDYIKAPQNIRLTQLEIDKTDDISQMLEYPDYVCQEIINELVHLVMENIFDQRLQTHPVVSQSIANPAQQQAPEAAGQTA